MKLGECVGGRRWLRNVNLSFDDSFVRKIHLHIEDFQRYWTYYVRHTLEISILQILQILRCEYYYVNTISYYFVTFLFLRLLLFFLTYHNSKNQNDCS